jgi:hypothetical protein
MDSSLSPTFPVSSLAESESKVREAETNDVVSTREDEADELLPLWPKALGLGPALWPKSGG